MRVTKLVMIVCITLMVAAGALLPAGSLSAQDANVRAISPALQQMLQTTASNEMITVVVELTSQANLDGINESDRDMQAKKVVATLRSHADKTQRRLRRLLRKRQRRGKVADFVPYWVFNGMAVTAQPSVIDEIAALPEVNVIIPNATLSAPAPNAATAGPEPNLALVNAPALWNLGFRGQGVVVANMDTGVDVTHPDLNASWRGGSNSWFDPYGEHPNTPTDLSGHGTWTMSVMVGGAAGGSDIGMAPDAQWIAVRVFNDAGSGTLAGVHAAFQWLLDPDGDPNTADAPDVVNGSWTYGGAGCDLEFDPDLQALRAAGILPIFAAGNGGPGSGSDYSPANNPSAFSVGAVANDDTLYTGSSRGPTTCGGPVQIFPDLTAPGVDIRSADLYGFYTTSTGTSLAAPHVAGALGLLLSAFPNLSVADQEAALRNGAADLGAAGPDSDFGYGRLDAFAAYQWIANQSNPTNQPPMVNAGADQTVTLPDSAVLSGTASDDGLPAPPSLTTTWSMVSGPGAVTFGDVAALQTTASFSADGVYTLRLTAADGQLTASDDVIVTVNPQPPANQPPTVNAGADQTVTLPDSAALSGTASDDGLPAPPSLTTTWSVVSGPGAVTFGDVAALQTTASFSADGVYILRLTVDDGQLTASDDVIVTVNPQPPANQPPTVNAGADQTVTLPDSAALSGTASDDGLPAPPSLTTTWSVVSGPGAVTFGDAAALQTTASFSVEGVYTLRLTVDDGQLTASDDVIVTVNPQPPANQSPVVYVSSSTGGKVGGVSFRDEDILAYDPATDAWSMIFDGSDVGLGGVDVDAFAIMADGSLLLSVHKALSVSGLGTVDDSDILRFVPTSLGKNTAGALSLYLRGKDVGLTKGGEDIDAIGFAPDGRLLVSTLGSVRAPGVSGRDEDLIALDASGSSWSLYFDGSNVGLSSSNEDIWGVTVNASGQIQLSTKGSFAVNGLRGKGADVFTCAPTGLGANNTGCDFTLYWRGADHGFGAEMIDGVNIGGQLSVSAAAARSADSVDIGVSSADAVETDEMDSDPDNGDAATFVEDGEMIEAIYLPLVIR